MQDHVFLSAQKGVTLIELIITIVIMGIALSALTISLSQGISRSTTPIWEQKAMSLAHAYMQEISAMSFAEQTPVGGGFVSDESCVSSNEGQNRDSYNDVDDYDGLTEQPPVLIQSNLDMTSYQQYRVEVDVDCAGSELGLGNNALVKRIAVRVFVPGGDSRSLVSYKGNF